MSLWEELSALQLVDARRQGELSARELVASAVHQISAHNPVVGAFVTVTEESAMQRALDMDEGRIDPGILWGLPFADKDLSHRAGVPTGSGSLVRQGAPLPTVSDPVPQALDDAGGISLGKTAVCEFGLTSYTRSQVAAPTLNPYSLGHGSGGSSGGAAAAVASRMVPCAPGNDGGGSVRIPAWTCGVVGIKPSRGLLPAGTGFDSLGGLVVPGPLANSVADAALLLDALRGFGPTHRATGHAAPAGSFVEAATTPPQRLRIGVTTLSPWDEGMDIPRDPEIFEALAAVSSAAEALGHEVLELEWTPLAGYSDAFHTLWQASAVSLDIPKNQRSMLEPMTRYLIERGERLSAHELASALSFFQRFETATIRSFSAVDVVLTPGLAILPPRVDFYALDDPELNFRQQVAVTPYSSFVNVCGLPALALPVMASATGLPVGVQLIGGPGRDALTLSLGAQLEGVLGWRGSRPPLSG